MRDLVLRRPEAARGAGGEDDCRDLHRCILAAYHRRRGRAVRPADRERDRRRRHRRARLRGGGRRARRPPHASSSARPSDVAARRRIDATGLVVAPGFIDLHCHSGLMIFADPLHEPKVRQGVTTEVIGVDGLSYAPIPDPADLEALVHMNAGLDGRRRRHRLTTGRASRPTWTASTRCGHRSTSRPRREQRAAHRRHRLGGGRRDATRRSRTCAPCCARRWSRAPSASRPGSTTRPAPTPTPTSWRSSPTEAARHGGFYHTHVRYALGDRYLDPFREAIEIGRRGEGPAHITHFYHRQTFPGGPGADAGARRRRARRGPRRHLRHLPLRVGQHAAADHDPAVGPGRRPDADEGAPGRRRRCATASGASSPSAACCSPGGGAWDDVRLGAFATPELPAAGRAGRWAR